jgi:hypothetical protein
MINLLNSVPLLLLVIGTYIYFKISFNKNEMFGILSSICFVGTLTYLLGIFGILKWSSIIYLLFCFGIFLKVQASKLPRFKLVSLGVLSILSYIWLKAIPADFRFVNWDEFVSWGPNIKSLTIDNSLYTNFGSNGAMGGGYKGYPPGQQILQYLLVSKIGWSEQHVIWAQGLVLIILFLFVIEIELSSLKLKKYLFLIPAVTMFYWLGYSFTTIYADGLIGVFGLAVYSLTKEVLKSNEKKILITLISPYALLVLIRPNGFCIALLVLTLSACQVLVNSKTNNIKLRKKSNISTLPNVAKKVNVAFMTIVLTVLSWQIYVKKHSLLSLGFSIDIPTQKMDRFTTTIEVFEKQLISYKVVLGVPSTEIYLHLNYMLLLICMIILQIGMSLYLVLKKDIYHAISISLLTLAGFVYFIFIFMLYYFSSDAYERSNGGSITRYLGSFFIIIILAILFEGVKLLDQTKYASSFIIPLLMLQFILPTGQMQGDFTRATPNADLLKGRLKIEEQANAVSKYLKKGDRVYYLVQGDMGYSKNVFGYLTMPNEVNWWCWSVGDPVFKGDIWTCDKNTYSQIKTYQYLVLGHNDGQITIDNFSNMLDNSSKQVLPEGIYRILNNDNSNTKLLKLEEFK